MKITLPYPPSANTMWRNYRGITVTSEQVRAYKQMVAYLARQAGVTQLSGDVILSADIYRPRRAGDLDNRLKCLIDALIGVAYNDDGQLVEIHARRFDDKKNPRVEVDIIERGN